LDWGFVLPVLVRVCSQGGVDGVIVWWGLGLAGIKERVSPTCPVQVLTKVLYIQSTRKKKERVSPTCPVQDLTKVLYI
jgi:hypothetical protein